MIVHPEITGVKITGDGYSGYKRHLFFIVSEAIELDGKRWRHTSVSRSDSRMPTYNDMKELKRLCIGDDKTALQVFPPKDKHVDIAGALGKEVLHLWCCLDGDVTPDFTRGGNTI